MLCWWILREMTWDGSQNNQFEQAEELLKRQPSDCQPRLVLNVPDGTNFFDIKPEDFELVDYDPVKPQLKFDLAI